VDQGGGRSESAEDQAARISGKLQGDTSPLGGDGSTGGEADRLARVERQLAELLAEVAQLKRMLSRALDRERGSGLPDGSLAAQVGVDVRAGSGRDGEYAEVVLAVLAAGPGYVRFADTVFAADPAVQVRAVVYAPAELHGWVSQEPSPLAEDARELVDGIRERLSQQAAGRIVNIVWAPATDRWQVTDFGGFDRMAGYPTRLDDWDHQQAGALAAKVGTAAGLPANVAQGAGFLIRYVVPLPLDGALQDLTRVIQVAGIAAFALPGGHVLACASLKSLIHDEVADLVAKQLRGAIWLEPAAPGSRQRPITESAPARPASLRTREPPVPAEPSTGPSSAVKKLIAQMLGETSPDEPGEPEPSVPPNPAEPHGQQPGNLDPGGGFGF
jgi:hypothetical protein